MSETPMSQDEWEQLLAEASEVDQAGVSSLFEDDETEFDPTDASESTNPADWEAESFYDDDYSDDEVELVTMTDLEEDVEETGKPKQAFL